MIALSLALFAACPDHAAERRASDSGGDDTGSPAADSDGHDTDTAVDPDLEDDCRAGIDRDGDGYAYCDQTDVDFEVDLYYRDAMDIAGDYDGDGRADLLFAGPNDTYDGIQAVVIPGSALAAGGTLDEADVAVVIASTQEDYYPYQAHARAMWAGDVDGDGRSDALVCDPYASGDERVYGGTCWLLSATDLLSGAGNLDVTEPALVSSDPLAGNGTALARIGDIDGDGRADLAMTVAVHPEDDASAWVWQASLILGGSLENRTGPILPSEADGRVELKDDDSLYSFGAAVDLGGEGNTALVMAIRNESCRVLSFAADEMLSATVLTQDAGTLLFDFADLGVSSCRAEVSPDLDGDGRPNLLVDTLPDGVQDGRSAWVLPTPAADGGRIDRSAVVEVAAAETTWETPALAGPGDLNGNGTNDLLVGYYHPLDDSRHTQDHHLAFLDGSLLVPGSVLDVLAIPTGWMETDMATDGGVGKRVAVGGDIDADGRDDMVFGELSVFGMFAW